MLLTEFDESKLAMINPEMFRKKIENFPKTAVSFFSKSIMKQFLNNFETKIVGFIENATLKIELYQIKYKDINLLVFHSPVGAPACVGNFEEIQQMGIKNLLLCGCCGCLKEEIKENSIILPTSALRDEGTSYHYIKESDEIELDPKMIQCIEETIKSLNLHYAKGKVWTTDALFRETKAKVEKRRSQGAIVVDMECSAMTAVSKFRNVNFGQIFYGADSLAKEEYDVRNLINSSIEEKAYIIDVAIKCAYNIDKNFN